MIALSLSPTLIMSVKHELYDLYYVVQCTPDIVAMFIVAIRI